MNFISRLRPYFFITDEHIEKAQALLSKHTGKALVIGRFTPATRALMPFLVGTTATSSGKFWIFNIIGGITWVTTSVLAGYVFGTAYHAISRYTGRALVIAILSTFIFIWGYKFINSRFHIFKKYELFTLILNIISLLSLATIVDRLVDHSFKLNFDIWISNWMDNFGRLHAFVPELAKTISALGSVYVIAGVGILMGLIFLIKGKWRSSAIMLLSISLTALISGALKTFFMTARPINSFGVILTDPSFPSTHSSMAAAFFVILAYLLAPKISSWIKRELAITACILLAIIIGLSRLFLNVHWFTDVVAGWSLGIFIATASILFVRYAGSLVIKKM
jgi:membrane-associated phospholipid phosphatase